MLAVMSSLAKQEWLRDVERIPAGIARARLKGTESGKTNWSARRLASVDGTPKGASVPAVRSMINSEASPPASEFNKRAGREAKAGFVHPR